MLYEEWTRRISNIVTKKYYDVIINLFSYVKNEDFFIDAVKEDTLIKVLNTISNTSRILIAFDLEFQNAILASTRHFYGEDTIFKKVSYSFIREFGIIIFVKSDIDNVWNYIGNIIVNFPNLSHYYDRKYIRYTSAPYASVSDETFTKMQETDNLFSDRNRNFVFNLYPVYASKLTKIDGIGDIILLQDYMYWSDPLVKKRTLSVDDAQTFLQAFLQLANYASCLIKGQMDFKVLRNHYVLLNNRPLPHDAFKKVYDIEVFNGLSTLFFKGAKLETTFNNLIKLPIYNISFFNKYIYNLKSHNPVSDSLYTIIVAIVIHLILNDYLEKNEIKN